MKRMEDIDQNFRVEGVIPEGTVFYDGREAPFHVYGLAPDAEGSFGRLPRGLLQECSEGVRSLSSHLAGGCVRFSTDAKSLSLLWELTEKANMPHFTASGQSGMELFEETENGTKLVQTVIPAMDNGCGCSLCQTSVVQLPGEMRHYALYLPLYNGLKRLLFGFAPDAKVTEGRVPRIRKPIVFYGSSITQGGCATKAGSCYTTILARHLDANQINLGFSGNAKGEAYMARYIASLEMSVFVLDYDHNAPTAEYLADTHEPFFRIIREAQPDLPVLIASRCNFDRYPDDSLKRRAVIERTYYHALEAGDRNVYFLNGEHFFGPYDRDLCTVDGCHPTDIGFLRMAQYMEPVLRRILYR